MDSALTVAAQPGLGLGGRRRRAARGAATATRASSPTRPSRPPTARSRSRSATTACSRGCARRSGSPSWPATSASPPTRRASSTATSSARLLGAAFAREPADALGRACCAPPPCPVGPINGVDEAFALADELGMEPTEEHGGVPLVRPPLRVDGERPPIRRAAARARRARRRDPGLAARAVEPLLEPPSEAAHACLSADGPRNLSGLQRVGALPLT